MSTLDKGSLTVRPSIENYVSSQRKGKVQGLLSHLVGWIICKVGMESSALTSCKTLYYLSDLSYFYFYYFREAQEKTGEIGVTIQKKIQIS